MFQQTTFSLDAAPTRKRQSSSTSAQPTTGNRTADPPCVPVTIKMIHDAAQKGGIESGKCVIYGDVQCGVVVVVGRVLSVDVKAGEAEFLMEDGTSRAITVVVDIRSENERWMLKKLNIIVTDARLRVVGQPHTVDKLPRLRALHFSLASAAESTYYHTIDTIHVFLKTSRKREFDENEPPNASGIELPFAKLQLESPLVTDKGNSHEALTTVELPPHLDEIRDLKGRLIVRYILDNRAEEVGASQQSIFASFKGKVAVTEIKEALNKLLEEGCLFETAEGWYDAVPGGD